jgi:DNA polymerase-3 subunit gamma/tau
MTLLRMLAFRPAAGDSAGGRPAQSAGPREPSTAARASGPRTATARAELTPRASATAAAPPAGDWAEILKALDLRGPARQLADSCDLVGNAGGAWQLVVPAEKEHLNTQQLRARLEAALREQHGRDVRLTITVGKPGKPTPAEIRRSSESARAREARETIEADPNVRAVQAAFDATLEPDSIRSSK